MKSYTLTLTEKDLQITINALAQRPYQEVAQLLVDIQNQVNPQIPKGNGAQEIRAATN